MARVEHTRETALRLALACFHSLVVNLNRRCGSTPLLLLIAAGTVLGDALGRSFPSASPTGWAALLGVCAATLAGLRLRGRAWIRLGLVTASFLWAGHAAQQARSPTFARDHVALLPSGTPVVVDGWIERDVPLSTAPVRLWLQAESCSIGESHRTVQGRIQIRLASTKQAWLAGERIRVDLRLRRPRNLGNPNEFDYVGYLATRAIHATAFLASDENIVRLGHVPAPASDWLRAWRRQISQVIAQTLPEPQSTVLAALIVGSEVPLPRDLRDAFRRAGVSHVLSISGLHVGLVAGSAYASLRWLLARSEWLLLHANLPKIASASAVLPVLLYAGIAGDNIATRRSVIMILVFLGAILVDRQRHLIVSLAVAACLIIGAAPGSSLDVSFELSFVAVLGLVLGIEHFWTWWRRWEELHLLRLQSGWRVRWARPLALYLAASLSAQVATTPLTAFHFNQVSLIAPVANALVVPLLGSLAVVLGLSAALLLPFSEAAASTVVAIAGPVVHAGIALTELCAALPMAALRVVTPSSLELVLFYLALLVCVFLRGPIRGRSLVVLAILLGLDAGYWYADRYLRRDLRVTFLSVGQGDSTVLEFPGGMVMVVDAGGSYGDDFDMGERAVAPFLWSRKIARVDYLVMSHPDRDHYGGLAFLATTFAPREFWSTGAKAPGPGFATLEKAIDEAQVRRVTLLRGDERQVGATSLRVLSPSHLGAANDNDESLVLRAQLGQHSLLLSGDIQQLAEQNLVDTLDSALSSTVLKAPHHGSRTSSTLPFLAAVEPRVAVISAGFANRFHFPSSEVLRRYQQIGSTVLRTDLDGAVEVRFDAAAGIVVLPALR